MSDFAHTRTIGTVGLVAGLLFGAAGAAVVIPLFDDATPVEPLTTVVPGAHGAVPSDADPLVGWLKRHPRSTGTVAKTTP